MGIVFFLLIRGGLLMGAILTDRTADRVLAMLNDRGGQRALRSNSTVSPPLWVLVRSDGSDPVVVPGIENQFYPATVIQVASDILYPPDAALDVESMLGASVLLTLIGDDVESVAPVAGKTYAGQMTGDVEADKTGSIMGRPRVVGPYIPDVGSEPTDVAHIATSQALPACTYNNGVAGVGATLTGNANGALTAVTFSGMAPQVNWRVLVKDQGNSIHNGVYRITQLGDAGSPFILTRDPEYDGNSLLRSTMRILYGDSYLDGGNGSSLWRAWAMSVAGVDDYVIGTHGVLYRQDGQGNVIGPDSPYANLTDPGGNGVPMVGFSDVGGTYFKTIGKIGATWWPSFLGYTDTILSNHIFGGLGVYGLRFIVGNPMTDGVDGVLGPGAEALGGIIIDAGAGTWLADPGDGVAGGTYP